MDSGQAGSRKKRLKVVIADDSTFMRKLIHKVLESTGLFEIVDEVDDGNKAITSYEENKPDLIILDINMPFMDGLTAAMRILEKDPQAKIVIVSAIGEQKLVAEKAKNLGIKAIIPKPFSPNKMIETLKKILEVEEKHVEAPSY